MDATRLYNRSLVRLVLVNALIKPIWILGIDRWVQNEVGLATYGSYFSILGITITAGFLLDLGLSTRIQREAAGQVIDAGQLSSLFTSKLLLLLFYFIVIGFIDLLNPSLPTFMLWGVALIQALQSLYLYFRSWVTAAQHFAADVWFSILDKALLIPFCTVWLMGLWEPLPIDLPVFIGLQAITLSLSILSVCFFLSHRKILFVGKTSWSIRELKLSWPYALIVLLMSALTRLDGYWLLHWSEQGSWEAGRYASGFRLLDAANMFGYLVASFLLPYLARHVSNKEASQLAIRNARLALMALSIVATVVVMFFANTLAAILYPHAPDSVSTIWPILFGSLIGYSLVHVYGTALTAWGELRAFQWVIAGALALHVILSACLIPSLGAMGSAIASWVSQVFAGLVLMFLVHQRLGRGQPYASYLVVIFTACGIWLCH
jgi:O-antigen/teichoic acid export membrane protein